MKKLIVVLCKEDCPCVPGRPQFKKGQFYEGWMDITSNGTWFRTQRDSSGIPNAWGHSHFEIINVEHQDSLLINVWRIKQEIYNT